MEPLLFFARELARAEVGMDELAGYEPAAFPTLDALLWRPVGAGMWRQCETFDGTYDCEDFIQVIEYLDVKDENQKRYAEWSETHQT